MQKLLVTLWIIISFTVAVDVCNAARAITYIFAEIYYPGSSSTDPDRPATRVRGLNNAGKIVGEYEDSTGLHDFIYDSGDFITFDFPNEALFGQDINGYDQVLGSYGGVIYDGSAFSEGIPYFTYTNGFNNLGQIVGRYYDPVTGECPYLHDLSNPMSSDCMDIPHANPYDVNEASLVVGYFRYEATPPYNWHGFLYHFNRAGTFDTIDFPGALHTLVYGINNEGEIVGYYADPMNHGFVYDGANFSTIDYPEALHTYVIRINDSGQVIGLYMDTSGEYHSFLGIPVASVSPTNHAFGITNIGCIQIQLFSLENMSSADLEIATLTVTGANASDFTLQNDTCSGIALAPSATCTFEVVFQPESLGSKEATVEIPFTNEAILPIQVPLSGLVTEICSCNLNGDNACNFADWLVFIEDWGNCTEVGCSCDLNDDGSCNFFDWLIFIEDWGRTDCPVCPQINMR